MSLPCSAFCPKPQLTGEDAHDTLGRVRIAFAYLVALGALGGLRLEAQTPTSNYLPLSPMTAQGSSPYAPYKAGDIDYVNPENGNVFLRIPLVSFPQRGKDLRLSFYIYSNDKQWYIKDISPPGQPHFTDGYWSGAESLKDNNGIFNGQPNVGAYVARDQQVFFGYDDNKTVTTTYQGSNGNCGDTSYDPCTITTDIFSFYAQSSDGAKHYIADQQQQTCQSNGGNAQCPPLYNTYIGGNGQIFYGGFYPATDGSNLQPLGMPAIGSGEVVDASGVHYTNNYVTDANGNRITTSSSGWSDTMGRSIPGTFALPGSSPHAENYSTSGSDPVPGVPTGVPGSCPAGTISAREWQVPAFGGATATYYLCYSNFTYQTAFDVDSVLGITTYQGIAERSSSDSDAEPATLLSAVVLPDGTSYTFSYDSYLSLSQVTLPTGGSVSYTWENVPFEAGHGGTPISRAIHTRTVTPGNGQPAETWTYHWYVALNSGSSVYPIYAVTTDPNGNDEERQIGGTDGSGQAVGETTTEVSWYTGCSPHDTASDRTCSSSSIALLKQEIYTLTTIQASLPNPGSPAETSWATAPIYKPTTIKTTYPGGSFPTAISQAVTTFTPSYGTCTTWNLGAVGTAPNSDTHAACYSTGQTQATAYYDYGTSGPGPPLKTVTTRYKWQDASSPYLAANLLNLPESVITSDGGGNWAAETDYGYDAGSLAPSGISDSTHVAPPATVRGNLTSTTRLLAKGGGGSTTGTTWYDTGMLATALDANAYAASPQGAPAKYVYGDCDGGGLTQTTNPLGQSTFSTYDCSSGLMSGAVDLNGNPSSYSYDTMNRSTGVTHYDQSNTVVAQTTISYPSPTTMQTSILDGATTTTTVDGVGRTLKVDLADPGANGDDFTNYSYNSAGLLNCVSNPHWSAKSATDGYTCYQYDALNRLREQIQPDGSKIVWHLGGNTSEKCDETGRCWKNVSDALGRLTSVLEPDPTHQPVIPTLYAYDALDNLTGATQSGVSGETARTRSFTYDSLSRLITARNPEWGGQNAAQDIVCYGQWTSSDRTQVANCQGKYDNNGNLLFKSDPRGVQIGYLYDALNRLTSKQYTNDPTNTPSVSYQYDTPNTGWGFSDETTPLHSYSSTQQTNLAGHLSFEQRSDWQAAAVYSYDAMGRVVLKSVCTPRTCLKDQYDMHYFYDRAGKLTFYDRGLDRNNNNAYPNSGYYYSGYQLAYDAADHLQSASLDSPDSNHPQMVLSGAQYDPLGQMIYGQMNAIYKQTRTYSNRGWYTGENTVTTSGQQIWNSTNSYFANGTVQTSNDGYNGNWTYGYDGVNRLQTAVGPSQTLNFSYDSFGNRLTQGTSSYSYSPNNQIAAGNGVGYDPNGSGDVTSYNDGTKTHQYVYDGENRLLSVDGSITYTYDAEGNRVAKFLSGVEENEYLYDLSDRLVAEIGPDSKLVSGNIYAGGLFLAEDGQDGYENGNGTMLRIADQVGTVRGRFDVFGNWVNGCASLPFGDSETCGGPSVGDMFFTGKLRDTDTSFDDLGARDYSSVMGRFLTPDWAADPEPVPYARLDNPQSLNLYAYVNNNPASNRDSDGHTHRDCTTSFNPTYKTGPGGDSQVLYVLEENCQFVPDDNDIPMAQRVESLPYAQIPPVTPNNLMFSRIKGERGMTGSANASKDPTKKARPRKDKSGKIIGWEVKDPVTGKMVPKSLEWGKANGLDPVKLAATAAGAAAASSIITEVLEAIGASALAF